MSTLDEKRSQLSKYRSVLSDTVQRSSDIMKLRSLFDSFPQRDADVKDKLDSVTEKYDLILKQAQVSITSVL